MCEERVADRRGRAVPSRCEADVGPERERPRGETARGGLPAGPRVEAHVRKVSLKSRLHSAARRVVQGVSRVQLQLGASSVPAAAVVESQDRVRPGRSGRRLEWRFGVERLDGHPFRDPIGTTQGEGCADASSHPSAHGVNRVLRRRSTRRFRGVPDESSHDVRCVPALVVAEPIGDPRTVGRGSSLGSELALRGFGDLRFQGREEVGLPHLTRVGGSGVIRDHHAAQGRRRRERQPRRGSRPLATGSSGVARREPLLALWRLGRDRWTIRPTRTPGCGRPGPAPEGSLGSGALGEPLHGVVVAGHGWRIGP